MKKSKTIHDALMAINHNACGKCMSSNCEYTDGKLVPQKECDLCYYRKLQKRLISLENEFIRKEKEEHT